MKRIHRLSLYCCGAGLLCFLVVGRLQAQEQFTLETAQAAAEKGDAKAQYFLGNHYSYGKGVTKDQAKAAEYFRKAAEQGLASAQNDLGSLYAKGLGVKQDYAEAAKWYLKAAEQGDELAQCSLGRAYWEGRGVRQNPQESLKWYRKAAEKNQLDAIVSLGDIYMYGGNGLSANDTEAFKYYTNAMAHGRSDCINSVGMIFQRQGNLEMALKYFREGAANRDGHADVNLGLMYRDGKGVQKDLVEAYKLFLLGERHGGPMGKHYALEMSGGDMLVYSTNNILTQEQIDEATRRADEADEVGTDRAGR